MSRMGYLCIAGGGTGGHVMPALALADQARLRWPDLQVQFIGAERGLEASLLPERGERHLLLRMHGIKGAGMMQKLRVLLWELPRAVTRILRTWHQARPDVVVGVGGYASASGVIAALIRRIPVVLYEQNAMPGLVNRLLGRLASAVMLGLPGGERYFAAEKTTVTGNVVRAELRHLTYTPHEPPCLLVMGGSQGARFLNETVPAACRLLGERRLAFTVHHLAGRDEASVRAVREAYRAAGIQAEVRAYTDDMPAFYRTGDVLLARAGAMTVSEACMCALPALFIPLPIATNDHQYCNARTMADAGAAVICRQQQATAERLAEILAPILASRETRLQMSRQARTLAPADAAQRQTDVLARYLPQAEGCS